MTATAWAWASGDDGTSLVMATAARTRVDMRRQERSKAKREYGECKASKEVVWRI